MLRDQLSNKSSFPTLYTEANTSLSIVKDLAIGVRSDLSFHDHFEKRLSKANSVFRMAKKTLAVRCGLEIQALFI